MIGLVTEAPSIYSFLRLDSENRWIFLDTASVHKRWQPACCLLWGRYQPILAGCLGSQIQTHVGLTQTIDPPQTRTVWHFKSTVRNSSPKELHGFSTVLHMTNLQVHGDPTLCPPIWPKDRIMRQVCGGKGAPSLDFGGQMQKMP